MAEEMTVGDLVAEFVQACGVETAFGVISVHNIPILDAIGRRNAVRFVPARGEAGPVLRHGKGASGSIAEGGDHVGGFGRGRHGIAPSHGV